MTLARSVSLSKDAVRALLATCVICSAGFVATRPMEAEPAQAVAVPATGEDGGAMGEVGLLQWAVREGGAFAVILAVLFFYRRDWARLNSETTEANKQLIELVKSNTAAMQQTSASIAQNTQATHRLARAVEQSHGLSLEGRHERTA